MKKRSDTDASVCDAIADTREQAANLRARAELMQQIATLIQAEGWKEVEAAERCGVTQPRINDLLRGRVSRFSLDALVNIAGLDDTFAECSSSPPAGADGQHWRRPEPQRRPAPCTSRRRRVPSRQQFPPRPRSRTIAPVYSCAGW
jgi:predicted XRE-type DNA-binding protein